MKIKCSLVIGALHHTAGFWAALVAVITFLCYLPALQGEFLIWDDPGYVVNNPHIHAIDQGLLFWAFTDMSTGFWLPATWISYAFDYRFWGLDPFGFHLTSLVLHALNSFLVVVLSVRLLQCAKAVKGGVDVHPILTGKGILIAGGVAGVLFGLHPQHVESVAWITERKDVLNALFFLLALLCYLSYTARETSTRPLLKSMLDIRYIGTFVFFLLSLLSKPMTVVFPLILLIIDWYPLARSDRRRMARILAEKLPFFLGAAGISIITMTSASPFTLVTFADVSPWSRILVAGKAVIAYLRMMLVPLGLSPLYEHPGNNLSALTFEYGGSLLLAILVTVCAIVFARRFPVWPAVWSYYLVTLLPVLGFVQNGPQEMADRFTYLPSIGPFMLVGLVAAWIWSKAERMTGGRAVARLAIVGAGVLYLLLLATVSLRQMKIWNNSVSLWNHVIENGFSRSSLAYNNRGMAFLQRGEYQQAIDDCTRALSIQANYHLAYYNRGKAFMLSGRPDLAMEDLSRAIAFSPGYADAYAMRGEIYREQGKFAAAIAEYTAALDLNPQLFEVYNYRGIAFKEMGQFDLAIKDYNRTIALLKDSDEAYNNRGVVNRHLGRLDLAIADYSRAIAINPGFSLAYCNRGIAYKELKNYQQAIKDFKKATSLSPDLIKAYLECAECFRLMGRPDLARQEYEAACGHNSLEGCNALKMHVN